MASEKWHDVGAADDLRSRPVTPVRGTRLLCPPLPAPLTAAA